MTKEKNGSSRKCNEQDYYCNKRTIILLSDTNCKKERVNLITIYKHFITVGKKCIYNICKKLLVFGKYLPVFGKELPTFGKYL